MTCSVSSSLARIADAEWARCCERVRKSSSQIGGLGEWRSLCDGGWTGKVPDDLPDIDLPVETGPSLPAVEEELNSDTDMKVNSASPANDRRGYTYTTPNLPSSATDSNPSQHDPVTMKGDIPALDHFPAPPVHFPLPHLQRVSTGPSDGSVPPSYGRRVTFPALPVQGSPGLTGTTPTEPTVTPTTQGQPPAVNIRADATMYLPAPSRSDVGHTPLPADVSTAVSTAENTEFGIHQPPPPSGSSGSSSLHKGSPHNSGVVLAMRNRFAQNVSYDRRVRTVRKTEFHSLCLQLRQGNLRLRFLVWRSVCQRSPTVINPVVSTPHCARTDLKWERSLNLPSKVRPAPISRYAFITPPYPAPPDQ